MLDETALLLAIGQQRLQLAGDADATRRAYALAANLLERVDDPRLLDLGQALVQERAALDALGPDPHDRAARTRGVLRRLARAGDAHARRRACTMVAKLCRGWCACRPSRRHRHRSGRTRFDARSVLNSKSLCDLNVSHDTVGPNRCWRLR